MAISDAVQTLVAAFSFGTLFQAASGTLFLYYKSHGWAIFQDGRRLVLGLFLLFAALWAQIDFLNMLLPVTSTTGCQVTILFSTMFDQLARVVLEQFLLWSVGHGTKLTAERLVLQVVLLLRLVAGGLLVGFTRPDFAPVCVARTSVLPIAIVVVVLDVIIIGVLIIRALSLGMFGDMRQKDSALRQEQSRALIFSIAGFTVWSGTSIAMILGIPSIILIIRTVVPAIGLVVLVLIITMFLNPLVMTREEAAITPEARSPFVMPMPPSRELFRENVASNGSPIVGHSYSKSGGLFVVNPSATPHDSPTASFQGNSRGDTRGFTKIGGEITVQEMSRDVPGRPERPEGKYGAGYRGSSGVFPSISTASMGNSGALAPHIRPNITLKTHDPSPVVEQKKSFFNWSKPPQNISVRSLGISQPVMANPDGSQPVARMQTIDLATAAINERKRREDAAARLRQVVSRPSPPPLGVSSQEGLRQSVSVKRKEMPTHTHQAMPSIPASNASGLSIDAINGSTTSASLSPGREEVRRRSPRNATKGFDIDEKPSRQLPLQSKRTIGLPSNPRAIMGVHSKMLRQQTVMLMNDIEYDDPAMVKTIIGGAPAMYASAKRNHNSSEKSSVDSTNVSLHSSNSILHRPRPYKRDTHKDRALFPSEPSPGGHRRSRSGSSVDFRKSFLMSAPGSPTHLPPLPPPPTSAAKLTRLLPNDTKSMTFDEKIQLLFPAPPGSTFMHKRRSSVPSLPRLPSVYMSESPGVQSPMEEESRIKRASKRATVASFGVPDVHDLPRSPKLELSRNEKTRGYRYSANTYRTIADEVGETWIPGIAPKEVDLLNAVPIAPNPSANDVRQSHFTVSTTTTESSRDSSVTYWASLHSEIPPFDLSKMMQTAQPTFIQRSGPHAGTSEGRAPNHLTQVDESQEVISTVVPDSEDTARTFLQQTGHNRDSFFLDEDQALPGDKTPTVKKLPSFHRRIGDELPTFSERRTNSRSRKLPPPAPLLLSTTERKAKVIVRATEPSPPLDSPERAIKEIQAQLKRFEEPSRGSVGSLLRHLPDASTGVDDEDQKNRLRLLENLEKEMGQQQDQWQQMQTNLDRNSMSSILTRQNDLPSEEESSQEFPQTKTPPSIVSRRARIRSSMSVRSKGEDSSRTNSTASSDNSRTSVWQQRLAEAQLSYLENAPDLLRKRSLNFLSVSKAQKHRLGNPTPPDSESDVGASDFDSESESDDALKYANQRLATLWQPLMQTPRAAVSHMWSPNDSSFVGPSSPSPPAKHVRPAQRRLENPLPIFSDTLWTQSRFSKNSRPSVGLWGAKLVRPRSIVTRRATQRPQRKSRRVTFLPDIVESPVPLPNKRDTLGIFQFPWGEKSDQPVYQPAINPALLAGPTINARLDARSRQLEPESEYTSSFFDDYEDEEMEAQSDDDFDETTLWEIASLLNTKDVPSKNSLLLSAKPEIIEDYDYSDSDSEQNSGNETTVSAPPMSLPIQPLSVSSKAVPQLWAIDVASAFPAVVTGLPEPEPNVWKSLIPSPDDAVRSKLRTSEGLPTLDSHDMWTVPEQEVEDAASAMWLERSSPAKASASSLRTQMWSPPTQEIQERRSGLFSTPAEGTVVRTTQAEPAAINMVKTPRQFSNELPTISSGNMWTRTKAAAKTTEWIFMSSDMGKLVARSPSLWAAPTKIVPLPIIGLFNVAISRSAPRTSDLEPAAANMSSRPRTALEPLSQLSSARLWHSCNKLSMEHHWISESSVRPESPSIYSATSSGNTSPSSDSSSIHSTSTKASSIWESLRTATAVSTWWEGNDAKKTVQPSPADEPSKLPVSQRSFKQLAPVQESRVLASRDLWEAKAPILHTQARRATATPAPKPVRFTHRFAVANWEEALTEAILAGTPKKSSTRPVARNADWDEALNEALALGKVMTSKKASSYDASVMHPIFFTEMLVSNAIDVHPAAIGYVVKPLDFDPSIMHPVFFTESIVSSADDVHPAAIGYVTKIERNDAALLHPVVLPGKIAQPGMWVASSSSNAPEATPLWSKNAPKARDVTSHSVENLGKAVRKALPLALLALESTTLWQPAGATLEQRNWLMYAKYSSTPSTATQTWAPRAVSHAAEVNENGYLWGFATPDMFAQVKSKQMKSSPARPGTLQRLNSHKLFTNGAADTSVVHWLRDTSAIKPSLTWTAPSKQPAVVSNLWSASSGVDVAAASLFSNPHSEPWSRKRREDASAPGIESQVMWRPSYVPVTPKNWLVNRRTSKVDIGY